MERLASLRPGSELSSAPSLKLQRLSSAVAQQLSSPKPTDVHISELLSYSLDRLRKEPELLHEERQHVERGLQASSLSHYQAFIDGALCLQEVQEQLGAVTSRLDALLAAAPQLGAACESFSSEASAVLEQQAGNKRLLASQGLLLELLDAPQLMDMCVRNAIYDEALDLAAFLQRLVLLHPELPVAARLAAEASAVQRSMLAQLLGRLQGPITLPECLRVVGYLRRMAAFPEAELRLQFLRCREEWLAQMLGELDDSEPYEYAKQLTDALRTHLFDVVMQYRAIFFDASGGGQDAGGNTAGGSSTSAAAVAAAAAAQRESSVLHSWVQHRLGLYLDALAAALPQIKDGGSLASVMEHCCYCGASLARVGIDFTPLLAPMFQACVLRLFGTHLALAVDAFQSRLEGHRWLPMPSGPMFGGGSAAARARAAAAAGDAAGGAGGADEELAPPYVLMEHLPLAVLLNGVLAALNELRHLALLPLQRPMGVLLQAALEQAASALVHYRLTRTLNESEGALFKAAARALLDVAAPYVASCFGRVFPGGTQQLDMAAMAGILSEVVDDPAAHAQRATATAATAAVASAAAATAAAATAAAATAAAATTSVAEGEFQAVQEQSVAGDSLDVTHLPVATDAVEHLPTAASPSAELTSTLE